MIQDLEVNKANAIAFYRTAYFGDPSAAVGTYVGAEYIQHNPVVRVVSKDLSIILMKWRETFLIKPSSLCVR